MKFTPEKPQQLMIDHLLSVDAAMCIVGMGIGKTAASLRTINLLKRAGKFRSALILAPMRVCNLTWPLEIEQWDEFNWMKVANLRTQLGRRAFIAGCADVYIINFESMNLVKTLVEKRGGEVPYDLLIIDESTKLKSHKSQRSKILRTQIPPVKRRWALTGTPTPNSIMDLWNQIRHLDDGERLGRSFDQFKKTFFHPTDYMGYNWDANPGTEERVQEKISDITITLRSSDWLTDVPDAAIEDVEIIMGAELTAKYKEFEKELILQLRDTVEITAANAAALVSKLLQFTGGAVYDANREVHFIHDLKLRALGRIVKQTKGSVLVACAFQHEQARIRKHFPQARFFSDATTPALQVQLLSQWNAGQIPILVAHPKSVGHGLNLQRGSNTMVWMSLTYSREDYEQCIARLVRRGQKDVVTVYRLMCPGTVDDVVAEVLQRKRDTEQSLLSALMMLESARELKPKILIKHEVADWDVPVPVPVAVAATGEDDDWA